MVRLVSNKKATELTVALLSTYFNYLEKEVSQADFSKYEFRH